MLSYSKCLVTSGLGYCAWSQSSLSWYFVSTSLISRCFKLITNVLQHDPGPIFKQSSFIDMAICSSRLKFVGHDCNENSRRYWSMNPVIIGNSVGLIDCCGFNATSSTFSSGDSASTVLDMIALTVFTWASEPYICRVFLETGFSLPMSSEARLRDSFETLWLDDSGFHGYSSYSAAGECVNSGFSEPPRQRSMNEPKFWSDAYDEVLWICDMGGRSGRAISMNLGEPEMMGVAFVGISQPLVEPELVISGDVDAELESSWKLRFRIGIGFDAVAGCGTSLVSETDLDRF
ncbi:hypothetical protein OGAPHI_006294 [Ogataea philodendri]|uniref:Uncharacterized protein n=1 Tax=Ogataea philodendri TaxID=1378263 RepID=A0A9P8NY86_9ASCO|nr:uncharacterized protein OGAPHI_006294 [Ogataea philodendri]KAH3662113.1 hypothetical protein OGAPHI_006294 [Ogataea philodendri]